MIRLAMEAIRKATANKAQREALGKIGELRTARVVEDQNRIKALQIKIVEQQAIIAEINQEIEAVRRGERDAELISEIVAKATEVRLTTTREPAPRGRKE